ncbi:hypothetical protein K2173_026527 [Erythroxylum novogranatense]|uniref:Uncharacterized protein n=1 Tax=Erythroxylum novogranatense TaxID=1862640 RepID=A0AAV8TYU0_9ROSI|nr:hypothetical protein K2173_026527 [Erythroxylum novogranatense]
MSTSLIVAETTNQREDVPFNLVQREERWQRAASRQWQTGGQAGEQRVGRDGILLPSPRVKLDGLASSSTSSFKLDLVKEIRTHEVAIAELNHISSSRAVYQKNGNILFRTTVQKASSYEQKQLELAKAKLEKLNSA